MKKTTLFIGAILFSATMFLVSCTKDETKDQPPTINFIAGTDYISSDATLALNEAFKVKIYAEENSESKSNITALKVTRVFNLDSWDTTFTDFNDPTISVEIAFNAQPIEGVENIKFEAIANDGQKASVSLKITTAGGNISTYTMKVLGSYQNPTGSSFASIDGSVYDLAAAKANASKVDFLYWWGASSSATIGAPDDPNAATVYSNATNGLATWSVRNATRFATTTVTANDFDSYTSDTEIIPLATGASETRLGSLAVGNVLAFKAASGKLGLIKITDITAGADGSITFDVKVQE